MKAKLLLLLFTVCLFGHDLSAQDKRYNQSKFKQLYQELATPNVYRTASGAPGHMYWQQQADYVMNIRLEDETQRVYGEETITYTNNSPDALSPTCGYSWIKTCVQKTLTLTKHAPITLMTG